MANTNAPFGLRPLRRLDGAAPNYALNSYQIAYGNSNSIGTGDLVKMLSTGYIDVAGTTDNPVLGVFAGCEYYDNVSQRKLFVPAWQAPTLASTAVVTAYVHTDHNLVFEVQASAGPVTITNVGQTAKIAANGAPNTLSGISTLTLDSTTLGDTTATYPLMVVGLSGKIGNDNTSAYNIVEVVLNDTLFKQGVTGLSS